VMEDGGTFRPIHQKIKENIMRLNCEIKYDDMNLTFFCY
jgi:hypothetical protein